MPNEQDIFKAIEDLKSSDSINITAVAKKYGIDRSVLSRRFNGKTRSREEITNTEKRLLTDSQESILIDYLNRLSNRGLHATHRILRNLVEETLQMPIGDSWTYSFVKRHSDQISSVYLKGFDRERKIADNPQYIAHFYLNVSLLAAL